MNRLMNFILALSIGLIGCGDGGKNNGAKEITGPGNSTENKTGLEAKPGDNTEITADNVHILWTQIYTIADRLPWRSMYEGAKDTLAGNNSGEVTITKRNNWSSSVVSISFTFKNYSEDGKIWIEGFLSFSEFLGKWLYTSRLSVAGEYKGVLDIDITVTENSNLVPVAAQGTINGLTVNLKRKAEGWVPIQTHSVISGRVIDVDIALSGVTVTLSGDTTATFITESDGKYRFTDLPDGDYTVTVTREGYTFSPPTFLTLSGEDVEIGDFIIIKTIIVNLPHPWRAGVKNKVTMELVRIPSGEEFPTGFYLGKYEVTQEQWIYVMEGPDYIVSGNYPILPSFNDAKEFVRQLNIAEFPSTADSAIVYSGRWKYHLPSDAEWEYACRAGTKTLWSFGNDERELWKYAWYATPEFHTYDEYGLPTYELHPVGMRLPNPWGLYDIHGNVWEWVSGGKTQDGMITRGGSYDEDAYGVRSDSRRSNRWMDVQYDDVGFRVVRETE